MKRNVDSRAEKKYSLPLDIGCLPLSILISSEIQPASRSTPNGRASLAIIDKLNVDWQIRGADDTDDLLQVIAIFSCYTDLVILYLAFYF